MTASSKLIQALIKGYQVVLSPVLGRRCRYHPTCSEYVSEAVAAHGTARGLWLGFKRLARCHPWTDGGHDPVPPALIHSHSCSTITKAEQ